MCGLIGYVGDKQAIPIIVDGLKRLEYRGYDSSGAAVYSNGRLNVCRAPGKLGALEAALKERPIEGMCGIGHTRWASHGRATEENAHPHRDCRGDIVVVHNGVIENYLVLKNDLETEGHVFTSDTDSEVVAHLIEKYFFGNLEDAVRLAIKHFAGAFALSVISRQDPNKIVVVRSGPPVIVGLGNGEQFVASDVPALLPYTRDMVFLEDATMAILTKSTVTITDFLGGLLSSQVVHMSLDPTMVEKGGYKHYMLKEIFEQPGAVRKTLEGRVDVETGQVSLGDMKISPDEFQNFRKVRIIACGTSWHAALAGKFMIEKLARLSVEVDYGSEFRYRDPILGPETLTVVISQSGETADTLAAQGEAKRKGSRTLAICNVAMSQIVRQADGDIITQAGPEIGVASTKAFTTQLTALFLLAMYLGQQRNLLDGETSQKLVEQLLHLPTQMEEVLRHDQVYEDMVKAFHKAEDFLYLGRGVHFPIALEGALKLKEISYIHAEGYPAGEMKHGPNALIDENLPTVMIATRDFESEASKLLYEKALSNIQEVMAREGPVVVIHSEGDEGTAKGAMFAISVGTTNELLLPILEVLPLQLLAYHIAVKRGCDVDQPRNLAKSVTVE